MTTQKQSGEPTHKRSDVLSQLGKERHSSSIALGKINLLLALLGSLFSLPLPDRIPYRPLLIALGVGALVMAALALVPRRRVQVATNVLVAIGTVFLAMQLVRIYTPPADPVAIDPPLSGKWAM